MDWTVFAVALVLGAVVCVSIVYFARTTWEAGRRNADLQRWVIAVRLAETPTVAAQSLAVAAISPQNAPAVRPHTLTPLGVTPEAYPGWDDPQNLES